MKITPERMAGVGLCWVNGISTKQPIPGMPNSPAAYQLCFVDGNGPISYRYSLKEVEKLLETLEGYQRENEEIIKRVGRARFLKEYSVEDMPRLHWE